VSSSIIESVSTIEGDQIPDADIVVPNSKHVRFAPFCRRGYPVVAAVFSRDGYVIQRRHKARDPLLTHIGPTANVFAGVDVLNPLALFGPNRVGPVTPRAPHCDGSQRA
jgi:hypothetical protein